MNPSQRVHTLRQIPCRILNQRPTATIESDFISKRKQSLSCDKSLIDGEHASLPNGCWDRSPLESDHPYRHLTFTNADTLPVSPISDPQRTRLQSAVLSFISFGTRSSAFLTDSRRDPQRSRSGGPVNRVAGRTCGPIFWGEARSRNRQVVST